MPLRFFERVRAIGGAEWDEPLEIVDDPGGSLDTLSPGAQVSHNFRWAPGSDRAGRVGRYWTVVAQVGDAVFLEWVA